MTRYKKYRLVRAAKADGLSKYTEIAEATGLKPGAVVRVMWAEALGTEVLLAYIAGELKELDMNRLYQKSVSVKKGFETTKDWEAMLAFYNIA